VGAGLPAPTFTALARCDGVAPTGARGAPGSCRFWRRVHVRILLVGHATSKQGGAIEVQIGRYSCEDPNAKRSPRALNTLVAMVRASRAAAAVASRP